jgi:hypothetical protein
MLVKRLAMLFVLGAAAACSTSPAPTGSGGRPGPPEDPSVAREKSNAETARLKALVRVTGNKADVAGCRAVGVVGGGGPATSFDRGNGTWYFDPPRKDTLKLGGNTLLTTDGEHGMAYLCPTPTKTP